LRLLRRRPPLRRGRVLLSRPGLRRVRPTRCALGHVAPGCLIRRVHTLTRAVLHPAHGRERHVGLDLPGAGLSEVRRGGLRRVWRLRLSRVAPVRVPRVLRVLRPHGLVGLIVVARGALADAARRACEVSKSQHTPSRPHRVLRPYFSSGPGPACSARESTASTARQSSSSADSAKIRRAAEQRPWR